MARTLLAKTLLLSIAVILCIASGNGQIPFAPPSPVPFSDSDNFQLALNLEYLEAEFYLASAYGAGLDAINASLNGGGPPPSGGRKAALSPDVQAVAAMLALQEVGHIRIIREFLGPASPPRPLINLQQSWQGFFQQALQLPPSHPPFDPYSDDLSWLLAAFTLPYVGLTAYVGANPLLLASNAKALLAGVLGVEGGQDALLRTLLWMRRYDTVPSLGLPVLAVTGNITVLRDNLDGDASVNDENIEVAPSLGAEGRTSTNILAGNTNSLSFARNAAETLRIVYGSGNASEPGGFFPSGATGNIALYFLTQGDHGP